MRQIAILTTLLILAILTPVPPARAEAPSKPKIAVIQNEKGRHKGEFDTALKALGWEAEIFPGKPEIMDELANRLGEFDMVVVSPLFSLETKSPLSKEQAAKYKKFISDGGLLAVTDGSYPNVREWLASIDADFGGLHDGKCNSSQWAVRGATTDPDKADPLRFFPTRITEGNSWPHFEKLGPKSKWNVVASCSEGFPVTFVQRVGKGLVTISSLRQTTANHWSNFYANLLLTRSGIKLQSFDLPDAAIGEGKIEIALADNPSRGNTTFIYEIAPEGGKPERFEVKADRKTMTLPYRFSKRGPVTTRFFVKHDGKETLLFSRDAVIPQLLSVKPNAYRGILSTARRFPSVRFGVELKPENEDFAGMNIGISVLDAAGKKVGESLVTLNGNDELSPWIPVELDQSLPAGEYKVRATLTNKDRAKVAEATTSIQIIAPQEGQTVVDEDRTLLVNGKPFFPLGLYHVKPEDYPSVAKLGINTVQFWTWHRREGLDKAQEHGLKAIFELNHKSEKIVQDLVGNLGDHPTILMWYGLDEPSESSYALATTMLNAFHAADVHRPVYMVSVRHDIFREQFQFADVVAPDPYGTPEKVNDWLGKAIDSVDNLKSVLCVPGVFGEETPEVIRASAYIAIAHDARGIIWYPWSQAGGGPLGVGLKTDESKQAVVKEICDEIKALNPAITATVRVPFKSEDGNVRGIYCKDASDDYVILVNASNRKAKETLSIPEDHSLNGRLNDFFKKTERPLVVNKGRFEISLDPYEVRVFSSK